MNNEYINNPDVLTIHMNKSSNYLDSITLKIQLLMEMLELMYFIQILNYI